MVRALAGLVALIAFGVGFAQSNNYKKLQEASDSVLSICNYNVKYIFKANEDGSLKIIYRTPQGDIESQVNEREGTGGGLIFGNPDFKRVGDPKTLDCISALLPPVLRAQGLSLPMNIKEHTCRIPQHGVERYGREFDVTMESGWRGGGYDPNSFCQEVVDKLKGKEQLSPESQFIVIGMNEQRESKCPPFNCPQYLYSCTVRVRTDPVYVESATSCP